MKVIIGLILFNSDKDVLFKNIDMLSKQSIFTSPCVSYEIVILDNNNGKQIPEIEALLANCKFKDKITLLQSKNIGFGAGHNKIFNFSKHKWSFDYYLCINPDGIAHYQMLGQLINFAKSKSDNGIFESIQFPLEHPKLHDKETGETQWCSGCCCLFPSKVFESLGGFDERFFMYAEDVDLSWRTRMAGYNCYTINQGLFSHSEFSLNRNQKSQQRKNMMIKSSYKLAKKYNHKPWINKFGKKLKFILTESEYKAFIDQCDLEFTTEILSNKSSMSAIPNFNNGLFFSKTKWKI